MNLKPIFRILFLLCLSVGIAEAQDFDKTLSKVSIEQRSVEDFKIFKRSYSDSLKWQYGLQLGANVSSLLGDAEGVSNQIGYLLGGFARYNVNQQWTLQAELNYSRQGAQQDGTDLLTGVLLDSGLTAASRYNYIAIPLSVRYYPWEDYGFFAMAGPTFSFLLNSELQGTGGEFSLTEDDRIDINDRLNRVDVGLNVGVGFTWSKNLDLTIRYKYGLLNTVDTGSSRTVANGFFNNRSVQILLAYTF